MKRPLHIEGRSFLINTFPCASLGDVGFHGMQDPPFWVTTIMSRKTRANRKSSSSSSPTFDSERFLSEKNQETYEKFNLKRNIWAERKILLDELDGEIRRNFERRGRLPLLDVDHPPPATLIKEFYSNFSLHSYDSNTLVRSWIRGDEYTITPLVVAATLGVPVV